MAEKDKSVDLTDAEKHAKRVSDAKAWLLAKGHKSSKVKAAKLKWDSDADITRSVLALHDIPEDEFWRAGGRLD